jgi:hypothetical protein
VGYIVRGIQSQRDTESEGYRARGIQSQRSAFTPACMGEGYRGVHLLCMVVSLGFGCASSTLPSVVDSPKMWRQCLPGHSCSPAVCRPPRSIYSCVPRGARSHSGSLPDSGLLPDRDRISNRPRDKISNRETESATERQNQQPRDRISNRETESISNRETE